jgi:hypothetical protein
VNNFLVVMVVLVNVFMMVLVNNFVVVDCFVLVPGIDIVDVDLLLIFVMSFV